MAALKLALAVALSLAAAASCQTPLPNPANYVCPAGWVPSVSNVVDPVVGCSPDPCFGACGAGNTCTAGTQGISGVIFQTNTCTCQAPSVLSHVVYHDFCYVPGTNVCNPSPCKNGATCQVLSDFSGAPGAYQCNNCPSNIFGRNCDLIGPPPTAVPKGMPTPAGPEPYMTF